MRITTGSRKIHGDQQLPKGYAFAFVPRNAQVASLDDGDRPTVPAPRREIIKTLAALVQAMYASYTLYMARGDQIRRYGYTAFGLTVLPYAVMSILNLIGGLLDPQFDELYLVQSDTLLEARGLPGAKFEGVIGRLLPVASSPPEVPSLFEDVFTGVVELPEDSGRQHARIELGGHYFVLLHRNTDEQGVMVEIPACGEFQRSESAAIRYPALPGVAAYGLVTGLSTICVNLVIYAAIFFSLFTTAGISSGTASTVPQRSLITAWLLTGALSGLVDILIMWVPLRRLPSIIFVCLGGIPTIGGFFAVGQILLQYGTCIKYD